MSSEYQHSHHLELFAALASEFHASEVKTRALANRQIQYVTARTVMNRLDDVLGPANWWDDFIPLEHSVICKLTICLPDGRVLTKADAGGYAGMTDPGDDDKSGYADAFKRAAVKWGVGRYLYRDGVPAFARGSSPEPDEPEPPASAPRRDNGHEEPPRSGRGTSRWGGRDPDAPAQAAPAEEKAPRTGRALFAWAKVRDEEYDDGLLKRIAAWGKRKEFPDRMVDWTTDQVAQAYAMASKRVRDLAESKAFQENLE